MKNKADKPLKIPFRWRVQSKNVFIRSLMPLIYAYIVSGILIWVSVQFVFSGRDLATIIFAMEQSFNFISRSFMLFWLFSIPFIFYLRWAFQKGVQVYYLLLHFIATGSLILGFNQIIADVFAKSAYYQKMFTEIKTTAEIGWISFFFLIGLFAWLYEWRYRVYVNKIDLTDLKPKNKKKK